MVGENIYRPKRRIYLLVIRIDSDSRCVLKKDLKCEKLVSTFGQVTARMCIKRLLESLIRRTGYTLETLCDASCRSR